MSKDFILSKMDLEGTNLSLFEKVVKIINECIVLQCQREPPPKLKDLPKTICQLSEGVIVSILGNWTRDTDFNVRAFFTKAAKLEPPAYNFIHVPLKYCKIVATNPEMDDEFEIHQDYLFDLLINFLPFEILERGRELGGLNEVRALMLFCEVIAFSINTVLNEKARTERKEVNITRVLHLGRLHKRRINDNQ